MFTQVELDFVKQAASKTKNQGELAVAKWIIDLNGHWYGPWNWSEEKLNIIQYCAEECKRQRSGEMSVYDMVNAWNWASVPKEKITNYTNYPITLEFIEEIGKLVEPIDNKNGFRTIPIGVNDPELGWIEKLPWDRIVSHLTLLLESYYDGALAWHYKVNKPSHPLAKTAEEQFYYEYENIHPFVDGNGRSGKILYNYLNGTLENPIMPPNFWGGSNP